MATHALQQPRITPEAQARFLKIPHDILCATEFVSRKTGEAVSLNPTNKILWCWMKCSYDSYSGKGNTYYESQSSIAEATGTSVRTVIRAMELFEQHGYLIKVRKWDGCVWQLPYSLEIAQAGEVAAKVPLVVAQTKPAANEDVSSAERYPKAQMAPVEEDECIFGPVIGSYGGKQSVDTASSGAGAVLDRFVQAQPAHLAVEIPVEFYADFGGCDYGDAEDIDEPF